MISKKELGLSNETLVAYFIGDYDYHFKDGKYYQIFQPGMGSFPREIKKEQIHSQAKWIK